MISRWIEIVAFSATAISLLFFVPFGSSSLQAAIPGATGGSTTQPVVRRSTTQSKAVFEDLDRALRICIVSDASGSMINKMPSLKNEINKAIASLRPEQSFDVIFMQDSKCDPCGKGKLLPATPENKKRAKEFLEGVTTTGTSDPIPAIEFAFKLKPQIVYLLTDGDFPDNDAVLKCVRDHNRDEHVKVYTIAFVNEGDTDTAFYELLKRIASENHGKFKKVNEPDL